MTHQLTELECTGNVARDNHRGGETCDGQCRCEYCWEREPTDAEVVAQLRAQLKTRDLQLQQQNEQCQILLAKLAEVRREPGCRLLHIRKAKPELKRGRRIIVQCRPGIGASIFECDGEDRWTGGGKLVWVTGDDGKCRYTASDLGAEWPELQWCYAPGSEP